MDPYWDPLAHSIVQPMLVKASLSPTLRGQEPPSYSFPRASYIGGAEDTLFSGLHKQHFVFKMTAGPSSICVSFHFTLAIHEAVLYYHFTDEGLMLRWGKWLF